MISHRTQLRDHDNAQADWADVVWWSYIADHYKVRPLEETLPTALAAIEWRRIGPALRCAPGRAGNVFTPRRMATIY